jgi:polyisoprenoid-binding protein YceI
VILSSLFVLSQAFAAANLPVLEPGSHCVAYKAEKTMFFVSSSSVIGKNCDISAQVLPEVGGLYHIEVIVPIKSFQSGDEGRDADVAKDLKVDVKPELTFKSKPMSVEDWRALFAKGKFELAGELSVGDKSYPLKVSSEYIQSDDQPEVDGIAKVHFQDFDITPPKVVAGIIAKTKPELELYFHLLGSRILGADSIRLEPKTAAKPVEEKK